MQAQHWQLFYVKVVQNKRVFNLLVSTFTTLVFKSSALELCLGTGYHGLVHVELAKSVLWPI